MTRQRRDELYPWLQNLTDEQRWKIWLTYDRVYKHNGYAPWAEEYDQPITTHDEAIVVIGPWLDGALPSQMEELEDELELSEEYKLANWIRRNAYERPCIWSSQARSRRGFCSRADGSHVLSIKTTE